MNNKLFIGSLPWAVDDAALGNLFAEFGEVISARVITDRESGRSRGFGFVEYNNEASGQAAIDAMNGKEVEGRAISVDFARPQQD
ncbi:RNA-binding protein [Candidatus Uhrbacteria bacterium]|jgi:cold-inducible RNA-binding protein|nr:RNA-binding protein [Candidatus Uhrbacteria bacterium]